jgi:hypothetical protein
MRMRIAMVAIACLAALGAGGCGGSGTCSVADNGGNGGGFATPQQALQSVLVTHPQWLSTHGWVPASRAASYVTYRSGNDSVDVVKARDGTWIVGAVTACQ